MFSIRACTSAGIFYSVGVTCAGVTFDYPHARLVVDVNHPYDDSAGSKELGSSHPHSGKILDDNPNAPRKGCKAATLKSMPRTALIERMA